MDRFGEAVACNRAVGFVRVGPDVQELPGRTEADQRVRQGIFRESKARLKRRFFVAHSISIEATDVPAAAAEPDVSTKCGDPDGYLRSTMGAWGADPPGDDNGPGVHKTALEPLPRDRSRMAQTQRQSPVPSLDLHHEPTVEEGLSGGQFRSLG